MTTELWFLRGVLERSRFDLYNASRYFNLSCVFAPGSDYTKAAVAVMRMDCNVDIDKGFQTLEELIKKHPDDMLFRWLFAIECREQRLTRPERSEEGARQYQIILENWRPGPVMVHHTYANILSEQLGWHQMALVHREIALEQSYKAWTCQGYGNTLRKMGRLKEAVEWLEKACYLKPTEDAYRCSYKAAINELLFGKKKEPPKPRREKSIPNLPQILERYADAAASGDPNAYIQMGILYRDGGKDLKKNQEKAAECFEKAYDAGLAYGALLLGIMYENGLAGSVEEELALKWFHIAADKEDDYRAARHLIYYYAAHPDAEKCDVKKAWKYVEQFKEKNPKSSEIQGLTAMVYARAGEFDKAIAIQQQIVNRYAEQSKESACGRFCRQAKCRLESYRDKKVWVDDIFWQPAQ